MKEIINQEKLNEIKSLYDTVEYLKNTISGFDDLIKEPSFVHRIYGDEHELCEIQGIDYEVVNNAFEAAKQVFVDEYNKTIDKINDLLN